MEQRVVFVREVSMIGVRAVDGRTAFYPLIENHHAGGILRVSIAPAPDPDGSLAAAARACVKNVMDALNYVGVLTVEFFVVRAAAGDGSTSPRERLIANEMAPRVHNSGHWTIEGSACSQFENHVRAVMGMELGDTSMRAPTGAAPSSASYAAMVNIIGREPGEEAMRAIRTVPRGARRSGGEGVMKIYGKTPRAGRKLGHVTLVDGDEARVRAWAGDVRAALEREATK